VTPHAYALLAQEAYSAKPDIGHIGSASRAIVRDTEDGLVVAFPGTDTLDGVITDTDVRTVYVPGAGDVHEGFWNAWVAIAGMVEAWIGDRPVTFVGHSLGAAIAIMAAITRRVVGRPVAAVYGFECPHVSPDGRIATVLAPVAVYLSKHGNDIVPDVPIGWRHAAPLTHIGKALRPFPNVEDHSLWRVIATLADDPKAPTLRNSHHGSTA
jgi:predicted lipase